MKKFIILSIFMILNISQPLSIFAKEKKDLSQEYFYIAEAYAELKKYEKAIEFYKKTLNNPEYANAASYNIARMHALLQQWNEAVSILESLYEKESTNEKILTSYAYALSASGKIKEAQTIYKFIYESNTENPMIAFNYVRILIVAKKYDEAKVLLKELADKFIEDEETKTINELTSAIDKLVDPLKEIKEKETLEEEREEETQENKDTKNKQENNDAKEKATTNKEKESKKA